VTVLVDQVADLNVKIQVLLPQLSPFFFKEGLNYLYLVPHNKGFTTEWIWQAGVDWVWDTFFYVLKDFNEWLIKSVLLPIKNAYLSMPVVATFVLTMGVAYIVAGVRSALIVGGFLLFIALTEWWDRALITAYLMTVGVVVSTVIPKSTSKVTEGLAP